MIDSIRKLAARHKRFDIQTPMRYRIVGEREWHYGTTLNISSSGILFEAETEVESGMNIEIRFALPVERSPGTPAMVSCRGTVVRSQESLILAARTFAARINRR